MPHPLLLLWKHCHLCSQVNKRQLYFFYLCSLDCRILSLLFRILLQTCFHCILSRPKNACRYPGTPSGWLCLSLSSGSPSSFDSSFSWHLLWYLKLIGIFCNIFLFFNLEINRCFFHPSYCLFWLDFLLLHIGCY
jgi:hypothetical protein